MLGSEPRTECSSSSLWAAKFRLLLLTASRRAEEAREATFLALTTIWEKEKEVLSQENRQLQGLLRQYMDGISVSDETLRRQNPLLMVSRPALAPPPGTERRPPRHTVVEAVRVSQNAR